ncbi:iron-containing alcohol dehydrogenase family protein [Synechococcus sp. CCY9201]|uniref:iron-containing alcohol dehydrogenase family protein n=1 Tax=unclassified Synechococcus TaxID=2626047 RepID=UPI0018CFB105|nr:MULTISPECIES: iron-containing alcohol dehydrogenase family protein [unclassified Synechococcus]MEA5423902.1 iron-containing alcohol dehydrogenase family protein [Synechococcus sp. CCY9202]MEA5475267.1 iron-containing alcohol dehydrogenase family protein [Synechococcus sp. CCY9201]QPN58694.1 iron-containing alcohol dehydrogenase family protein [Synechococcus sp. CBW1002]QPN65428.1 iron-containing alcohol dehydrogenase family protein [Synechococcus sp. CBW1006]
MEQSIEPVAQAEPEGGRPCSIAHVIAPARVLRGPGAWLDSLDAVATLTRRPLLLGRSNATQSLRASLLVDLQGHGCAPTSAELQHDCCEEDLETIALQAQAARCDGVIAAGGGKVLDAGKLLADRLGLSCVTVPTSAATCAGWTALANLYSPTGAFQGDVALQRCPDLLVFDHRLVRQAPLRTLASGIADAVAKWYEASVSSGASQDGVTQQAVQMARVLRDQLLLEGVEALAQPGGAAWDRVAEACGLTAGLIGGIGGARCRTVVAHAVHNGLTQLRASHGALHGEKVGFGILVQLRLEEVVGGSQLAAQARRQLLPFFRALGLPVTLEDLGLAGASLVDLQSVCAFACQEGSDLHHLPFPVGEEELLAALVSTTVCRALATDRLSAERPSM